MKINVDGIEVIEDDRYYRINIKLGTHKFHSEKLNEATASKMLFDLTKRKK